MIRHFSPLPSSTLAASLCFRRAAQAVLNSPVSLPSRITLDSPATDVLTDFKRIAAVTIDPGAAVDDANLKMIENGIRLLLVVHDPDVVSGIVTASDIFGEKPMQIVQERGIRHNEIEVRDIMTSRSGLVVIQMRDVISARVGHVVTNLKHSGRQHAMVVEPNDGDSCQAVRGLFSASQIARQLGVPVHAGDVVRTFSEIEVLLNREHFAARAPRFL
jgi:CBS domain-containing protein